MTISLGLLLPVQSFIHLELLSVCASLERSSVRVLEVEAARPVLKIARVST